MTNKMVGKCNCCGDCKKYHVSRGIFGTNVAVDNNGRAYHLQSGDSEALAKSILTDFAGLDVADRLYRDFVHDFIACLPVQGFTIPGEAIKEWLEEKGKGITVNLYVLKFRHFAPKDSEDGIKTYLIANSCEEIYEWLKTDPEINEGTICTPYKCYEESNKEYEIYDEDYKVIGTETFKERMCRLQGDMFDGDVDISDAYYGITLYGWEIVKENIKREDALMAREKLGINIIDLTGR